VLEQDKATRSSFSSSHTIYLRLPLNKSQFLKMKSFVQTLLPLLLVSGALSAPAPAPAPAIGVTFPITDLIGTDLTVEEYAAQLEAKNAEPALTKRQFTGNTYNQLTDGTACRAVTVIWARGTAAPGNVGLAGSEGPAFFNALASALGGTSRLAIQGVTYSASVVGFLAGGDSAGATTMFNLINQAVTRCPSTKIVVSGYSQGAQLVHTATQRLTAANAAKVSAGKSFFPILGTYMKANFHV
jgi:cutinase